MTTEKQLERGVSEIVGVFTGPIIVFPGGWGDALPEWLFHKRTHTGIEKEQADRQERKEEKIAKVKAEQPAPFES